MSVERSVYRDAELKVAPENKKKSIPLRIALLSHNLAAREGMGRTRFQRIIQDCTSSVEDWLVSLAMSDEDSKRFFDILENPSIKNPEKIFSSFSFKETKAEQDLVIPEVNFSLKKREKYIRMHYLASPYGKITSGKFKSAIEKIERYIKSDEQKLLEKKSLVLITYRAKWASIVERFGFTVAKIPYMDGNKRLFRKTLNPINPETPEENRRVYICYKNYMRE